MSTLKPALPRGESELGRNREVKGTNSYYYAHNEGWEVPENAKVRAGPGLVTGGAPVKLGADGQPKEAGYPSSENDGEGASAEVVAELRRRVEELEGQLMQARPMAQPITQFSFSDEGVKCKVALLSGNQVHVQLEPSCTVEVLMEQSQQQFGAIVNRLIGEDGRALHRAATLAEAGLHDTETVYALLGQEAVAASGYAFVKIFASGSVVTWGSDAWGGDSGGVQPLMEVAHVQATERAFAAILRNGTVVTWGSRAFGGGCTVQAKLRDVQQLQASERAFAAILAGGSVLCWGSSQNGGDCTAVQDQLVDVSCIQASRGAFAAIHSTGSVTTWGHPDYGGDSAAVRQQLAQVRQIQASGRAFAAIRYDGSVVTWGCADHGGDSTSVQTLLKNVEHIQASETAFAAILVDGSVVTWGYHKISRDLVQEQFRAVQQQLLGVRQIQACQNSFAAIRHDGRVVGWGPVGVLSGDLQAQLRDVRHVQASSQAFAAICGDGSVVTWGSPGAGGDSSAVQHLLCDVQQIQASERAFAALLRDGRMVTWGDAGYGGDCSALKDRLLHVQQIQASKRAFAAILADGSVVTCGFPEEAGAESRPRKVYVDVEKDVLERQTSEEGVSTTHEAAVVVSFFERSCSIRVAVPGSDGLAVERRALTLVGESDLVVEKCTYKVDRAKGRITISFYKKDEKKRWQSVKPQKT
ncbi:hypothetical protein AK812_SmicGene13012 [Symbiodinium microadriaticum]|uniref:Ubiquitin-like domain-containing protein n=1 Tax=Symbiodinium microadriaticum TaxID=2951 RepID=A0A1Q9E9A1_SYMMI|nr:hypothetical protein AK812_SmicGene13012 [Symbiodinium microadriaticum]